MQATGRSHMAAAARVWALTAATSAAGLLLELYARQWAFAGLALAVAALSVGWFASRRRLEPRPPG
jgi:hypothetical protein